MTARTRSITVLALVSLLSAGCSSGGDDEGVTAQPEGTVPAPTTTAAPEPESTSTTASEVTLPPPLDEVDLELTEAFTAEQPVAVIVQPGTGTLHVVERAGFVRPVVDDVVGEPLVDISGDTVAEGERGLLGAAFSPDGERLYLSYTNRDGDSRLDEWTLDGGAIDAESRRTVLSQSQPFANHNGGHITFGPDGLLWYALGDGGAGGDPGDRAQDTTTLLGKLLRFDPAAQGDEAYGIPADNPYAGGGGRGEIAVLGVRNPWRFSFDRETGSLWVADVGQNEIEEVTALPAGEILGANLGWNRFEGSQPFEGEAPPDVIGPTYEYTHAEGVSITGGVVYRGEEIPGLRGAYLFGDLATAEVWALPVDGTSVGERVDLGIGVDPGTLVSFAEDADGEVYVISIGGSVLRLSAAS